MARVFFGLLKFVLYSKYERRLKGRHEGYMYALLRRLTLRHQVQN